MLRAMLVFAGAMFVESFHGSCDFAGHVRWRCHKWNDRTFLRLMRGSYCITIETPPCHHVSWEKQKHRETNTQHLWSPKKNRPTTINNFNYWIFMNSENRHPGIHQWMFDQRRRVPTLVVAALRWEGDETMLPLRVESVGSNSVRGPGGHGKPWKNGYLMGYPIFMGSCSCYGDIPYLWGYHGLFMFKGVELNTKSTCNSYNQSLPSNRPKTSWFRGCTTDIWDHATGVLTMTGIGVVKKMEKSCEIPSSTGDEHP